MRMLSVSSGRGTHSSHKSGANQNTSLRINLPHRKRKTVNILEFVRNVNVELYSELSKDEQEDFLLNIDAIELFDTLMEVDKELARTKLDIHYLTDFLEQNQPKLLIGLKQRRSTASAKSSAGDLTTRSSVSTGFGMRMTSFRPSITGTGTTISLMAGSARRGMTEYRLNFRTKADMAEKSANDIKMRIKNIEKEASHKITHMRARIDEQHCRAEETEETLQNFALHFMADESDLAFLETASEKQLVNKLHQFTRNWFQNARGQMATMRLRMQHLHENCQQYQSELHNKLELSKQLSVVDFDHIMMNHSQLQQDYAEKQSLVKAIKLKTGKASMAMGDEKASLEKLEEKHKEIQNKIDQVVKEIVRLEQECAEVEISNKEDKKRLEEMESKRERYHAPSVGRYIAQTAEISVLEKEEKMLKRKINIMTIKLKNLKRRYKMVKKVSG